MSALSIWKSRHVTIGLRTRRKGQSRIPHVRPAARPRQTAPRSRHPGNQRKDLWPMKFLPIHIHMEALRYFGYTEEEAEFPYLVATHSGYFTCQQFLQFIKTKPGKRSVAFARKVVEKKHASSKEYLRHGRVFHLFSRNPYEAIGRENIRFRRIRAPPVGSRALSEAVIAAGVVAFSCATPVSFLRRFACDCQSNCKKDSGNEQSPETAASRGASAATRR
jgi:hypothetical protein